MAICAVLIWPTTKLIFRVQGRKFGLNVYMDHKKEKWEHLATLC